MDGGILRGSVKGMRYNHYLIYKRDYTTFFIEWLSKRWAKKYYISWPLLIRIVRHHNKKYGGDCARNPPHKPSDMNIHFGRFASADYCPINIDDGKPMNGECCRICFTILKSKVYKGSDNDGSESILSEYNKEAGHVKTEFNICDHMQTIDIMRIPTNLRVSWILPTRRCLSRECIKLDRWMRLGKKQSIQLNKPSETTLYKYPEASRKPLIAARYLDYKARLKIHEKGLIDGH